MLFLENIHLSDNGIVFTDKQGNRLSSSQVRNKIINRIFNWFKDFKLFILHLISLHIPFHTLRKMAFSLSGMKIGRGSTVHMGTKFFEPNNIQIGDDTIIGDRVFLDGRELLRIGNHVDIASEVMIYNSEHDIDDQYFKAISSQVIIGDYVFVGPRAIILPGVEIGRGAVVAAGAVVTKSIPEFEVVGGVPAKKIRDRILINPIYKLGRARLFQ